MKKFQIKEEIFENGEIIFKMIYCPFKIKDPVYWIVKGKKYFGYVHDINKDGRMWSYEGAELDFALEVEYDYEYKENGALKRARIKTFDLVIFEENPRQTGFYKSCSEEYSCYGSKLKLVKDGEK